LGPGCRRQPGAAALHHGVLIRPLRRKNRWHAFQRHQVVLPAITWGGALCSTGFGELLPMLLALNAEPVPGYRCRNVALGCPSSSHAS
jgi:hypothetical protein